MQGAREQSSVFGLKVWMLKGLYVCRKTGSFESGRDLLFLIFMVELSINAEPQ